MTYRTAAGAMTGLVLLGLLAQPVPADSEATLPSHQLDWHEVAALDGRLVVQDKPLGDDWCAGKMRTTTHFSSEDGTEPGGIVRTIDMVPTGNPCEHRAVAREYVGADAILYRLEH